MTNAYVEYTVVVRATDPAGIPGVSTAEPENSDVVTVVIRVTDVNDVPVVTGNRRRRPLRRLDGDITTALGDGLHCDRR